MNPFDAVIAAALLIAMVLGFRSGFLRSMVTIFAYVAAAPVALAAAPTLITFASERFGLMPQWNGAVIAFAFIAAAVAFGTLFRLGIDELIGPHPGLLDRLLGALLGAARIGLTAVVLVLIFERIIPPGREPEFLRTSALRPSLSAAGRMGLRALPPEAEAYIERMKRERGI